MRRWVLLGGLLALLPLGLMAQTTLWPAANVDVQHSPANYTEGAGANLEGHLEGIDAALTGGGGSDATHQSGAGAPTSETCVNIGGDRYTDTTNDEEYYCSAVNTWTKFAGGGGGGTECSTSPCDLNAATTLGTQNICLQDGTDCPPGGGDPQTPWAQNIDGAGFKLTNLGAPTIAGDGANLGTVQSEISTHAGIADAHHAPTGGTDGQVQYRVNATTLGGISEGSSGEVLTSQGAGTPPTFQALPAATPGGNANEVQVSDPTGTSLAGITNGTAGQLLTAQGSGAPEFADKPTYAINELSDVNTSGVAANDVLRWSGSQWEPVAGVTSEEVIGFEIQRVGGWTWISQPLAALGYYQNVALGASFAVTGTYTQQFGGFNISLDGQEDCPIEIGPPLNGRCATFCYVPDDGLTRTFDCEFGLHHREEGGPTAQQRVDIGYGILIDTGNFSFSATQITADAGDNPFAALVSIGYGTIQVGNTASNNGSFGVQFNNGNTATRTTGTWTVEASVAAQLAAIGYNRIPPNTFYSGSPQGPAQINVGSSGNSLKSDIRQMTVELDDHECLGLIGYISGANTSEFRFLNSPDNGVESRIRCIEANKRAPEVSIAPTAALSGNVAFDLAWCNNGWIDNEPASAGLTITAGSTLPSGCNFCMNVLSANTMTFDDGPNTTRGFPGGGVEASANVDNKCCLLARADGDLVLTAAGGGGGACANVSP